MKKSKFTEEQIPSALRQVEHVLLRRKGRVFNHNRVHRLYKLAGVYLRSKRLRRQKGRRTGWTAPH